MKISLQEIKNSDIAEKFTLVVALFVLIIVFSVLNGNYMSAQNMVNILVASTLVGFAAIGETFLIIATQIDLSVGATVGFTGVLSALLVRMGVNPFIALVIAVLSGGVVGMVNSMAVNHLKLQPFIATLATMSIMRGMAYIICDGKPVAVHNELFIAFGTFRLLGIPMPVWLLIVAFMVLGFVLSRTYFGRSVYVIGGNPYAARLCGLNPTTILTKLYIINGCLAGLAGVFLAARMNSGQPPAGTGLEFTSVTAAVLGGTAFTGGVGTMLGTFLGMLILQSFNNGLLMLNVQIFWQNVAQGLLLIVALAFDYYRKRRHDRKVLAESLKSSIPGEEKQGHS
jgi:ribose transport system permease protein